MNLTIHERRYLEALFADAGRVELRHCPRPGTWNTVGWYSDADLLLVAASSLADAGNLFTSLNHVKRAVEGPVTNDDVDRCCRLLFDLDPERPTDTSSSDTELTAAKDRYRDLQTYLRGHGWPLPAVGMSGNGAHLQYRTALPNTPEVREQLTVIYTGLRSLFSDDAVKFDPAVRNPGRICTLYGSVKRKGPNTPERPHRRSTITLPATWEQVRHRQIDTLANHLCKTVARERQEQRAVTVGAIVTGTGDYASLDVVRWFQAHGLYVKHLYGHIHGVKCPWEIEHTTPSPADGGDVVIFEADGGWPGFHCKHSHCAGRGIREVIATLGGADAFCSQSFTRGVQS
jgi:hypothetical protein